MGIIRGRSARALSTGSFHTEASSAWCPYKTQISPIVTRSNIVILLLSGEFPFGIAVKGEGNIAGESRLLGEWEFQVRHGINEYALRLNVCHLEITNSFIM